MLIDGFVLSCMSLSVLISMLTVAFVMLQMSGVTGVSLQVQYAGARPSPTRHNGNDVKAEIRRWFGDPGVPMPEWKVQVLDPAEKGWRDLMDAFTGQGYSHWTDAVVMRKARKHNG